MTMASNSIWRKWEFIISLIFNLVFCAYTYFEHYDSETKYNNVMAKLTSSNEREEDVKQQLQKQTEELSAAKIQLQKQTEELSASKRQLEKQTVELGDTNSQLTVALTTLDKILQENQSRSEHDRIVMGIITQIDIKTENQALKNKSISPDEANKIRNEISKLKKEANKISDATQTIQRQAATAKREIKAEKTTTTNTGEPRISPGQWVKTD